MPKRLYIDLMPRELVEELLLYVPMDQFLQDWLDLLVVDKFYTVLSATSPFWRKRFRVDISSTVNPPPYFDRNDYLGIFQKMDTLLYSKERYAMEHHYDKLFKYLRNEYNKAIETTAKTGNIAISMNLLKI